MRLLYDQWIGTHDPELVKPDVFSRFIDQIGLDIAILLDRQLFRASGGLYLLQILPPAGSFCFIQYLLFQIQTRLAFLPLSFF